MMPTHLAKELATQSGDFLRNWKNLVDRNASFSPSTAEYSFRIQALDSVTPHLIVPALREIRETAPHVSLSVGVLSYTTLRETLETGETDIALGQVREAPQNLLISQLTSYEWCCIAAKDHPRIGSELTLEDYAREAHVMLTFGHSQQPLLTERYVNDILEELNIFRRVAIYLPTVLAVPDIVAHTDLLALLPRQAAEKAATRSRLNLFEAPFTLPQQDMSMIWHARTTNDSAHRWFRDLLRRTTRSAAVKA
jgi:DNA-binding transcriptional LysR family regulator